MGTIRVHEFTSLDGVIDNPTWTFDFGYDPAMGQDIGNLMSSCDAILLGRNTYEMFEPAWSTRTADEDPGAPFMNESAKYVVSSTLKEGTWQNSKIVGPYSANAIRQVKADTGRPGRRLGAMKPPSTSSALPLCSPRRGSPDRRHHQGPRESPGRPSATGALATARGTPDRGHGHAPWPACRSSAPGGWGAPVVIVGARNTTLAGLPGR